MTADGRRAKHVGRRVRQPPLICWWTQASLSPSIRRVFTVSPRGPIDTIRITRRRPKSKQSLQTGWRQAAGGAMALKEARSVTGAVSATPTSFGGSRAHDHAEASG